MRTVTRPTTAAELVDEARAATLLNLSRRTLQRYRQTAFGPPWRRVGMRAVRYPRAGIDAWLQARNGAPVGAC